jgi:phage gp36-like protein
MALISKQDLDSFIAQDDLSIISEGVNTNIDAAIKEAEETVKDYLRGRYDIDTIFSQVGASRNTSIVSKTIDIAVFLLHRKLPSNMIPERRVFFYETAMQWLQDVSKGEKITLDAPVRTDEEGGETGARITYGSNDQYKGHGY